MKVAILSMQKVYNFGSFLQSYCLKSNIELLGHKCDFIDIKDGEILNINIKKEKVSKLRLIDKHILKRVERYFFVKKRNKIFEVDILPKLGIVSGENNWNKRYDVVIIGSDEVFNCLQDSQWGFSKNLLGGDINANRIITYAASCGHTTYDKVKEAGLSKEIEKYFENISIFSVRDKNTKKFVEKLSNKEIIENLDPVFTYNFNKDIPNLKLQDDYILVYGYDNRINDIDEINAIKDIAKKNNLRVVSVGFYQRWCDENVNVTAFELIEYIRSARFIITDTFHGTIFSIKYNKRFATIIRDTNREKLYDLLCKFNLENRQVENLQQIDSLLKKEINYEKINLFIENEKNKSIKYLKENIF